MRVSLMVILAVSIWATPAFAEECAGRVQQYLNIVCGDSPSLIGKKRTTEVSAEAEGRVSRFFRLFFVGEARVGGKFSEETYSNYAQQDLPEVHATISNCRQKQFAIVVEQFCRAGAAGSQLPPPLPEPDDHAALFLPSERLIKTGNLDAAVNDLEQLANVRGGRVRLDALMLASYLLTEVAESRGDRGSLTRAHRDLDLAEPLLVQTGDAAHRAAYLTVRARAYLFMASINSPSPYASEQVLNAAAATAGQALQLVSPGDPDGIWGRAKLTQGLAVALLGIVRKDVARIPTGAGHLRGARAEYERQGNHGMVAEIDYHLQEICRRTGIC